MNDCGGAAQGRADYKLISSNKATLWNSNSRCCFIAAYICVRSTLPSFFINKRLSSADGYLVDTRFMHTHIHCQSKSKVQARCGRPTRTEKRKGNAHDR